MRDENLPSYLRPNPSGDWPKVDPTAFVDPSAQIIGNVHIGPKVFVGPQAVIRADEPDKDGKVHPIIIEAETNIQDGVIIHSRGGTKVIIGAKSSIAHGVIIHGPCIIGKGCFIALRSVLYKATLEDEVWVGLGSVILKVTIPSHTMIPAGSVIRSNTDIRHFRFTNNKEEEYQRNVFEAASSIREGYRKMQTQYNSKYNPTNTGFYHLHLCPSCLSYYCQKYLIKLKSPKNSLI